MKFIAANFTGKPDMLQSSLRDLKLGTFDNVTVAKPSTTLTELLTICAGRTVSCVPIVDEFGTVLDVFEKYDVSSLVEDEAYRRLDMSVQEVLSYRSRSFEGVHTCTLNDTLRSLLDTIRDTRVHRFIVVDSSSTNKFLGLVSLSDLLRLLLL